MNDFGERFEQLTGHMPLAWQTRLYERFAQGNLPRAIDLPTGLGKTMVMAIWLIAREKNPKLPRRLVYVVDRRTVVDQATDIAIKLQSVVGKDSLAISTLRGQLADNREWSKDPSRPAIIIGTVDLIGSALLFSGYRSSFRRRPLEAGLLGVDSLIILDEAHLSHPFEKLLDQVERDFAHRRLDNNDPPLPVQPVKVIRMSATSSGDGQDRFTLEESDLADQTIKDRFNAKKNLSILRDVEKDKLNDRLADQAVHLAADASLKGKRIVIFVRKPDDARSIAERIRKHQSTKAKPGPYTDSVEVLTGTLRGLERDELVEKPVLKRFLDGDEKPGEKDDPPVFLVATSAGEVGFDLNADHMVCDTTTLDSFIQRLGRVNRRGYGDAKVVLVLLKEPPEKTDIDKACIAATKLLTDGMSLSPRALAAWKATLTEEQIRAASSPEPLTVPLTDILLDNWSMTSITGPMPGRPEVGPWLRGIEQDAPQVTVAWRAELDLLIQANADEPLFLNVLRKVLDRHPVRPHETLTIPASTLKEFLKEVAKVEGRANTPFALRFPSGKLELLTPSSLLDKPNLGKLNADPTVIFPASFGGLDSAGMLDEKAVHPPPAPDADTPPPDLDVADEPGYEPDGGNTYRLRLLIARTEDGSWQLRRFLKDPELEPDDPLLPLLDQSFEKTTRLFDKLRATNRRVRLVIPFQFDDEGDPVRSLVLLAPAIKTDRPEDQSLDDHVAEVVHEAQRIAASLHLPDSLKQAVLAAARYHDEGKKARVWQRYACNEPNQPPKGKTSRTRSPESLAGYRHEFGSLLRLPLEQLPQDPLLRDIALHLVAAHHGFARPHFDTPIDREKPFMEAQQAHLDLIRRFAHLQRKYGWWTLAWLENLLRCPDQLASAGESEDDPIDTQSANTANREGNPAIAPASEEALA